MALRGREREGFKVIIFIIVALLFSLYFYRFHLFLLVCSRIPLHKDCCYRSRFVRIRIVWLDPRYGNSDQDTTIMCVSFN